MKKIILIVISVLSLTSTTYAAKICECYALIRYTSLQNETAEYVGNITGIFLSFGCSQMVNEYVDGLRTAPDSVRSTLGRCKALR